MITLHRLGHAAEPFHLNPDLIVTVEGNPDTVVTLTTGTKIVVAEPPESVIQQIKEYRVAVLSGALSAAGRTATPLMGSSPAAPRRACSCPSTAVPAPVSASRATKPRRGHPLSSSQSGSDAEPAQPN